MPTNHPPGENQHTRRDRSSTGNKTRKPGSGDTGKNSRRSTGMNEKNR